MKGKLDQMSKEDKRHRSRLFKCLNTYMIVQIGRKQRIPATVRLKNESNIRKCLVIANVAALEQT